MSFALIQHYQFPLRDPFEEGHILTATEAHVLNWHRARLIQKIVHRWVMDAQDECTDTILSVEEMKALTDRISEFDRNYELQPAKEPKTSILEYNLEMLAGNFLSRNGNLNPRKEDIEAIKRTPEIQAKARDLIKSSTFSFEELFA
jgi:hypothetical protein